jgi:hypothetical protein
MPDGLCAGWQGKEEKAAFAWLAFNTHTASQLLNNVEHD